MFDFNRIDSMTYFKIRTELVPVISKKYPFDLAAAQKGAKSYLSDLLVPTEREIQFIDEFRKKNYRPELLFEDSDIVSRIKNHPMALWKMQHE